ncbi:MAG: hypothetical protein OSA93_13955 [Akkermansiaceae bacterium]|nr:hypothetical protein [Akkermansiaceae bacterium]
MQFRLFGVIQKQPRQATAYQPLLERKKSSYIDSDDLGMTDDDFPFSITGNYSLSRNSFPSCRIIRRNLV